ncbi:unnamed protein product [Prorocentrum cordatum]|uniref:Protein kinase domain-containing protein n=1 Tax=Prorocentrum cordatum TaxID=2364126 RepID=A0ABN9RQX2_9DINO|nr:unnamed protein product [Polarella glacialis]
MGNGNPEFGYRAVNQCTHIKPWNLMLAGCGNRVKLVAFGLACFSWDTDAAKSNVGSVGYLPPEMLPQGSPALTTKADCYCAGALLYTCLAGHGPFHSPSQKETLAQNALSSICQEGMARLPTPVRELVLQLLPTKPEERPTARQCLQHPWLACAAKEAPAPAAALALPCLTRPAPAPGSRLSEARRADAPARTDTRGAHSSSHTGAPPTPPRGRPRPPGA